jgi:hypothetical protein
MIIKIEDFSSMVVEYVLVKNNRVSNHWFETIDGKIWWQDQRASDEMRAEIMEAGLEVPAFLNHVNRW